MKAKPDCIACMFWQTLRTVRLVSDSPEAHMQVLARLGKWVSTADLNDSPAALSKPVYEIICELTGNADPFKQLKSATNAAAERLAPALRPFIERARNPLEMALRIAAAGNLIDFGVGHEFDVERDVLAHIQRPFALSSADEFARELKPGRKLLYLGDNAGEIVFDRLLVEYLRDRGLDVTFAVKSGPIINDATMEDAVSVGMTRAARVIETGGNDIGINWANVSAEFLAAVDKADVIVAKGHGNFETCDDRPENIYFLLKAKCHIVAEKLGVEVGDIVFARGRR